MWYMHLSWFYYAVYVVLIIFNMPTAIMLFGHVSCRLLYLYNVVVADDSRIPWKFKYL